MARDALIAKLRRLVAPQSERLADLARRLDLNSRCKRPQHDLNRYESWPIAAKP